MTQHDPETEIPGLSSIDYGYERVVRICFTTYLAHGNSKGEKEEEANTRKVEEEKKELWKKLT